MESLKVTYEEVLKKLKKRQRKVTVRSLVHDFCSDLKDYYELGDDERKKLERRVGFRIRKRLREGVEKGEVDEILKSASRGHRYGYVPPKEQQARKQQQKTRDLLVNNIQHTLRQYGFDEEEIEGTLFGTSVHLSAKKFFKLISSIEKGR